MAEFTKFDINQYGSQAMANAQGENDLAMAGMIITFTHVPSGNVIAFKAFITAFNETYGSDWTSEVVYGRADPIMLFKNTTRKITLAFQIPAMTTGEAYENLGKVQMLTQFLYPTYKKTGQAQTITQSPLIRIQVMNLLQDAAGKEAVSGDSGQSAPKLYENYKHGGQGVLGAIGNVTVNHNLEGTHGVVAKGAGGLGGLEAILPKLIEINLEFTPIHEHPLGWNQCNEFGVGTDGDPSGALFPYGVQLFDASDGAKEKCKEEARNAQRSIVADADADAPLPPGYPEILAPYAPLPIGYEHLKATPPEDGDDAGEDNQKAEASITATFAAPETMVTAVEGPVDLLPPSDLTGKKWGY